MSNRFEGIVVVDNVIDEQYQQHLNTLFLDKKVPWFLCKEISGNLDTKIKTIGFAHDMFVDNSVTSNNYLISFPLLLAGCAAAKIKFIDILRATSFLLPPTIRSPDYVHDSVHINFECDHIVGLYYINDSDGDTIFFDKSNIDNELIPKEIYRSTPKMGRMVFFDGAIYHAATKPKNDLRCVVTFDFIGTKM